MSPNSKKKVGCVAEQQFTPHQEQRQRPEAQNSEMDHLTCCANTMCGMKSKIPIESFRNATEAGTILLDIVNTLGRWRT